MRAITGAIGNQVTLAVALTALLFAVISGIWQTNGFEWRRIPRAGAR